MSSSHSVDENLEQAAEFIREASSMQSRLAILPEMFAIMGKSHLDNVSQKEIFGSGKIQDFLSKQAKQHKIWIVGGTIPIACDEPMFAVNLYGAQLARGRQLHRLPVRSVSIA